jgi:hypothetical protein
MWEAEAEQTSEAVLPAVQLRDSQQAANSSQVHAAMLFIRHRPVPRTWCLPSPDTPLGEGVQLQRHTLPAGRSDTASLGGLEAPWSDMQPDVSPPPPRSTTSSTATFSSLLPLYCFGCYRLAPTHRRATAPLGGHHWQLNLQESGRHWLNPGAVKP